MSTEGIIIVALKETYQNTIEKEIKREISENESENVINSKEGYIVGPKVVYPYDTAVYTIENAEGGTWEVSDLNKVVIGSQNEKELSIGIYTGKKGSFTIIYKREVEEDIVLEVTIGTL